MAVFYAFSVRFMSESQDNWDNHLLYKLLITISDFQPSRTNRTHV